MTVKVLNTEIMLKSICSLSEVEGNNIRGRK
jgi:hypothetical protein